RRQWIGVTITAAGLVVIGLTGGGANHPKHASLGALIAVEGAIFGIGAALLRISHRGGPAPRPARRRALRALGCRHQVPPPGATRPPPRVGQPVGADGDDRRSDLVL